MCKLISYNKFKILIIFIALISNDLAAVTLGSDFTIQSHYAFSGAGNRIANDAKMDNGFSLVDELTTCSFDSFFPVSGSINLNLGMLFLNRDLILNNGVVFGGGGKIYGNNHSIQTPKSFSTINISDENGGILTLIDEVLMGGDVYCVDWSYGDNYIAAGCDSNGSYELAVYSFDGNNLTLQDSVDMGGSVYSVHWHPTDYYITVGRASAGGTELRLYYYNTGTNSLSLSDGVEIGSDVQAVAWSYDGNYLAVGHSKIIKIYSFSGGSLTYQTEVSLSPSQIQRDAIDWKSTNDSLVVGARGPGRNYDLFVFSWDGSVLNIDTQIDVGATIKSVSWRNESSLIAVGLSGGFFWGSETIRIYKHSVGSLTEQTSARIGATKSINGLDWDDDGNYLVIGTNAGSGTEFRTYRFNDTGIALQLVNVFEDSANIYSVRYSHDGAYIARGDTDNYVGVYGIQPIPFLLNDVSIVLNSDVSFNVTTTFQGNCSIFGNGHILDFSSGNTINIDDNSTLKLRDVFIKDYGLDYGGFLFTSKDSELRIANSTIELTRDITTDIGGIYVDGPTTLIIKNHDWTFDSQGSLTVDGVTLWKDYADQVDNVQNQLGDIIFGTSESNHKTLISGGTIQGLGTKDQIKNNSNAILYIKEEIESDTSWITRIDDLEEQLSTIDRGRSNIHFDSNVTLSYNIYLGTATSYSHKMYIHGGSTITVDGSGKYVHFSREASDKLLEISANTKLIFQDIVLKDFLPQHINFASGASIEFGDGTTIELAQDADIDSNYTMSFDGSVIFNGYGHEFNLSTAPKYAMEVLPTATLTVENIRITGLGDSSSGEHNLKCNHRFSTLEFRNCDLMLTGNYTFSEGFLNFYQDVNIKGKNHTFAYQSPRQGKISTDATLFVDRDVTFSYDAGNWDFYKTMASKTAFILEDASSIFYLNGSTLHSTRTGLQLETGTLVIDDKVTLTSEAIYRSEAMVLKSNLDVKVLGGANLQLFGVIEAS